MVHGGFRQAAENCQAFVLVCWFVFIRVHSWLNQIRREMIWDAHCHLSGVTGDTPEARLAKLLEFADRMGIERLCVSMGLKWSYGPSPEDLRRQNDEVLRAVSRFPDRAFGFVYLNPNHVEASLAELDRCVRDGPMVGAKLWVARHCNAPELDPDRK